MSKFSGEKSSPSSPPSTSTGGRSNPPGQKGKFAAEPLKLTSGGSRALRMEEEFLLLVPAWSRLTFSSLNSMILPVQGSLVTPITRSLGAVVAWRRERGEVWRLQCSWAGPVSWIGRSSGCSRYCSETQRGQIRSEVGQVSPNCWERDGSRGGITSITAVYCCSVCFISKYISGTRDSSYLTTTALRGRERGRRSTHCTGGWQPALQLIQDEVLSLSLFAFQLNIFLPDQLIN